MILVRERNEGINILTDMIAAMMSGISLRGRDGADMRRVAGDVVVRAEDLIDAMTIGTELRNVFLQATLAGATLDTYDKVRDAMIDKSPIYRFGLAVKLAGIVLSFAEQCKLIADMAFVSRTDVQRMMTRTGIIIEELKIDVSEMLDGVDYQNVIDLSALLVQHLAATERQLPRIVSYNMTASFPSLTLANQFYADASRSDEIISENKTVHPLFCRRDLRVLSE